MRRAIFPLQCSMEHFAFTIACEFEIIYAGLREQYVTANQQFSKRAIVS